MVQDVDALPVVASMQEHLSGLDLADQLPVQPDVRADDLCSTPERSIAAVPRLFRPSPERAGPVPAACQRTTPNLLEEQG